MGESTVGCAARWRCDGAVVDRGGGVSSVAGTVPEGPRSRGVRFTGRAGVSGGSRFRHALEADGASAAGDRMRPALGRARRRSTGAAEQQRDERERLRARSAAGSCSRSRRGRRSARRRRRARARCHSSATRAAAARVGGGAAERRRPSAAVVGARGEGLGDARAGARERLAAQRRAPGAADQHRGEVVDRAARAAGGGVAAPAVLGVRADAAGRVRVVVAGTGQRTSPPPGDADAGQAQEVLGRRDPLVGVRGRLRRRARRARLGSPRTAAPAGRRGVPRSGTARARGRPGSRAPTRRTCG